MPQFRNTGNDTYRDAFTGKTADPDGVIDVPDEWVSFYADHPIWKEVGAPPAPKPVKAAPPEPVEKEEVTE
jgi:hypothetical protein